MSKLLFIALIIVVFAGRPANAITVSQSEKAFEGVKNDGQTEPLANAETVTIDANLDSPRDVQEAVELGQKLVKNIPADRLSVAEIANKDEPLSAEVDDAVDSLRTKASLKNRMKIAFSREQFASIGKNLATSAKDTSFEIATSFKSPRNLTLMFIRFMTASGATYWGLSIQEKVPVALSGYFATMHATAVTGVMSAAMVAFSAAYSKVLSHRSWISKQFDEAEWVKATARYVRKKGRALHGDRSEFKKGDDAPVKVAHYVDTLARNLFMEAVFVTLSKVSTEGFWNALNSCLHSPVPAIEGGLGQAFFDQSIDLYIKDRKARVLENLPEGPQRDKELKRLSFRKDVFMAIDSVAQVTLVMTAMRGFTVAKLILHFYVGAAATTRFILMNSIENRVILREQEEEEAKKTRRKSPVRCEALLRSA